MGCTRATVETDMETDMGMNTGTGAETVADAGSSLLAISTNEEVPREQSHAHAHTPLPTPPHHAHNLHRPRKRPRKRPRPRPRPGPAAEQPSPHRTHAATLTNTNTTHKCTLGSMQSATRSDATHLGRSVFRYSTVTRAQQSSVLLPDVQETSKRPATSS